MKGWFLRVIIEDKLFMLEFFRIFRIGIVLIDDLSGQAFSLILGIWKFETNITIAFRKKLQWDELGEA